MAVSTMSANPQDPSIYIYNDSAKDESLYPMRRKPSRTLLYIRNRANSSSVFIVCLAFVLSALTFHRGFAIYMSSRRWINAPITYIERQCPAPPNYETIDTQKQPNICLTTLTDSKSTSIFQRFMRWRNFDGIIELTWNNKLNYAKKHGYTLFDGSHLIDTSRPPAWSKIKAVQHLLESQEQKCDWIMWTDADTVIMNSEVKIHDFLPQDPTKDLLVGSDNGGGYNSGVFLLRNSEWSKQFLQQWWDMKSYVRPAGLSLSGDNNAMKALLRDMPDFHQKVLSPPRCTFNSFAKFFTVAQSNEVVERIEQKDWYMSNEYYHKSDFIAHVAGYDNKSECLRLLLAEAI